MGMWETSKPMCSEHTLKNFIESFVQEHTLSSGGEMVLDVSPEDIQALGDFFVRGTAAGHSASRQSAIVENWLRLLELWNLQNLSK